MRTIKATAVVIFLRTVLLGHSEQPGTAHELLTTWALDPFVIGGLALTGWLYLRGARHARAATGREVPTWEFRAFIAGWLALFVALVSPLHPLGEVLFSAHMTQHEFLMLIAAPLLVLSRPLVVFIWALPPRWRHRAGVAARRPIVQQPWHVLTNPLAAWALHAAALWIWHLPALFDATLHSDFIHTLQHISFLGTALLFWWSLIRYGHGVLGYGSAVLYVFTTSVHSSILGALITFSERILYPTYAVATPGWAWTPLEDQQLGGLIMWVPAALVYIVAGLALVAGWIAESERRVQRRERRSRFQTE